MERKQGVIAAAVWLALCVSAAAHLPEAAAPVVGMMYEGWHAPAYFGRGTRDLTVESVLRSDGKLRMSDMQEGMDVATGMNFYFHKEPKDGFYCIYRKRHNESVSSCGLPDCPNITATLTRHANELVQAGVEFIVADSTNIMSTGAAADALQLRPWEVLAEEWLALRNSGVATPQIAIWQNLQDPAGNLWREYVVNGAYSDPVYDDMIFKDPKSGKKVFFCTANPTAALVSEIESFGLVVVTMWAERDNFAQGEWAFFSPCIDNGGFTSSVSSDPSIRCSQKHTTNGKIGLRGTALTVGPSYQLSYSSLPFMASGKLGTLTLKKQFETAFSLYDQLDYLMVGTYNEHVAQPQANPYNPPNNEAISMGMQADPFAASLWVDMYGDAITRDLERSVEDGGRAWETFLSCMRVFRTGSSTCNNSSEACCVLSPQDEWHNVYSLVLQGNGDYLLTTEKNERDALVTKGWEERCPPFGGSTVFCPKHTSPSSSQAASKGNPTAYANGPFLFHRDPLPASASLPVYRCLTPQNTHLIASSSSCGGFGKAESVLGHAASTRSSDTPRRLRACRVGESTVFYHSLESPCVSGDTELEVLGYVH